MLMTTAQSTCPTTRDSECNSELPMYFATYNASVCKGFKVLDALEAQNQLIRKQDSVSCYMHESVETQYQQLLML